MRYLEAPNYLQLNQYRPAVFLAGTITGAGDWQNIATNWFLENTDLMVFNPRRKNFNVEDDLDQEQIEWEFEHLKMAQVILFWFTKDTVAPIALFELGKYINGNIVVGCDVDYPRRKDLEIQMDLERLDLKVHTTFKDALTAVQRKVRVYTDL